MNCNICNKTLLENEIGKDKGFMQLGMSEGKPIANNRFILKIDGGNMPANDLCFKCGRKIRDFIENLKIKN